MALALCLLRKVMNKIIPEAWYHFVAVDMGTGKVILHERLRGQPKGVGLRNYWANSIHYVIRNIQEYYYWEMEKTVNFRYYSDVKTRWSYSCAEGIPSGQFCSHAVMQSKKLYGFAVLRFGDCLEAV